MHSIFSYLITFFPFFTFSVFPWTSFFVELHFSFIQFSYVLHKSQNRSDITFFWWIMLFSKKISKKRTHTTTRCFWLHCMQNQTNNIRMVFWNAFNNAKAKQTEKSIDWFCLILSLKPSNVCMVGTERGRNNFENMIENFDFSFCNVTPAQHVECLLLLRASNLCNKCHVLPFIACPSHFSFIFFFVDGFSKKIHSLSHWLVPKKIRVTHEIETISTRKSDQMCLYLNIILALVSLERFFFRIQCQYNDLFTRDKRRPSECPQRL